MRFLSPARLRNRRRTHRRLSARLVVMMLKAPGDVSILRYKEWGSCQRVQCGASVGRGTGSQRGLEPGGPGTLCPLRSRGCAYGNCPTSGRGALGLARRAVCRGSRPGLGSTGASRPVGRQLAGHHQMTAPRPRPLAPRLALGEAGICALNGEGVGRGGAPLQQAPWLHTPGAGHMGSGCWAAWVSSPSPDMHCMIVWSFPTALSTLQWQRPRPGGVERTRRQNGATRALMHSSTSAGSTVSHGPGALSRVEVSRTVGNSRRYQVSAGLKWRSWPTQLRAMRPTEKTGGCRPWRKCLFKSLPILS